MQLRFYWDVEFDDCVVRQVNAKILYGCEYQSGLSRLVITPLTNRCWLTDTGGLHVKLGSAPAGPAGTGKTSMPRTSPRASPSSASSSTAPTSSTPR
jgi:dynein heavy chain